MKLRYYFIAAMLMVCASISAQETYENVKLTSQDLNGTARYVGMGGAMDALGADLSTMNSNPAGIGLFRSTQIAASGGLVMQHDGNDFDKFDKTNASFDQIGVVLHHKSMGGINVAFGYQKSKNFDYILSASDNLNNAALNKLTYIKGVAGYLFDDNGNDYITSTRLDELVAKSQLLGSDNVYRYTDATGYTFNRGHEGYIGEYSFNVSGNINDRIFLGLTFSAYDVHYDATSDYAESFVSSSVLGSQQTIRDHRRIHGQGADVKIGAIFRPIETSPFRIGLAITSPTYYDLTSESSTSASNGQYVGSAYDFRMYTPWKFALSVGHTVGKKLALGAVYEFQDYGTMNTRIIEDSYYDYWTGYAYDETSKDADMNEHAKQTLKGVSTLKLGLEYKVIPQLALRAGYNYVSPIFSKSAAKGAYENGSLVESPGIYYSSTADYTNWQDTHRFTLGLGGNVGNHFLWDIAYQYTSQKGEFHPFMDASYGATTDTDYVENYADPVEVNNKRSQLLFTLGYKF